MSAVVQLVIQQGLLLSLKAFYRARDFIKEVNFASMIFFSAFFVCLGENPLIESYSMSNMRLQMNQLLTSIWMKKKNCGLNTERKLFTVNLFEIDNDDSRERKTNGTDMKFVLCIHTSPDVVR